MSENRQFQRNSSPPSKDANDIELQADGIKDAPDEALKERFDLALRATETAIWDWDIEKKLLWNSRGIGRLTGRGDAEFTQHFDLDDETNPWLTRIHPDDREPVLRIVRDHLEKDTPFVAEYRFRAAGDDYIWLRTVGRSVRSADGRAKRLLGSDSDITEHKAAETALQESETLYRGILDNMIDTFYRADKDGVVVLASPSCEALLGYTPEEAVGTNIGNLYADQAGRDGFLKAFADSGGEIRGYEAILRRKDGRKIWVATNARTWKDANGEVLGIEGTVRDITKRKQAEEALRHSEEQLSNILDNIVDSVVTIDTDGVILSFNRAAESMFGYDAGEVIGGPVTRLMPEPHAAKHHQYVGSFLASGESAILGKGPRELEGQRKDGTLFPIELAISEIHAEGRRAFIGAMRDISVRKAAEADLSETRLRLIESQEIGRIGSWNWDLVSDDLWWSDGLKHLYKMSLDDPTPPYENFLKSLPPEDARHVDEKINEAVNQAKLFSEVYRYICADESEIYIHGRGEVFTDDAGKVIRMAGTAVDITRLKTAELALRKSEARLSHAQEIANMGSWEIDHDNGELVWSDEVYRIVGIDKDTFVPTADAFFACIHPDDVNRVRQEIERRDATGEFYGYEHRIVLPGGEIKTVYQRAQPHKDEMGELRGTIGIIQDITERKKTENTLRESEAHLAQAQALGHIGSWWRTLDSRALTWTDEVYRIFGVEKGAFEPTIESFQASLHPEDVTLFEDYLADLDSNDSEKAVDLRIIRPNGEVRYIQQRSEAMYDISGAYVGRSGTTQDITDRKQAEQALREIEERFRAIFEQAAVGIGLMTPGGRLLMVNQKLCELMDRSEEELMEKRFTDFIDPKDLGKALQNSAKLISGEIDTFSQVIRYAHETDKMQWGKLTGSVIRQADSDRVAVLGIVEDVTEVRRAEERLRQAQKMEAVGQLTGGVAHDFNNLLTVIMGNLALMRDSIDADEGIVAMIERSLSASERGAALTDRLLAFSRKQTLMPSTLDLGNVISGMSDILKPALGEKVNVRIYGAADLWLCDADQSQLENALLNLAINARDAMRKRGGSVTIEAENLSIDSKGVAARMEMEPGDYVTLTVSDTGGGMAEETMARAFEPFFTTKPVGEGSGLGLSMVYGFAKQSGGNVTINSTLGEGTRVTLYLPRSVPGSDETAVAAPHAEEPRARAGERILIVEDDAEVRSLTVTILSGLGYEIAQADSADKARHELNRAPAFDLLLTDVILTGGTNGPDLAAEIRGHSPSTKIVYMTGYAEEAFGDQAKPEESARLIRKPFKKTDLAHTIRSALDAA